MEDEDDLTGQFARLPDGQKVIVESAFGPSVLSLNLSLLMLTFQ